MKRNLTVSERLLSGVSAEMKRRKVTLYRLSKDIGRDYMVVYYIFNPMKKVYKRKGPPKFGFDIGMDLSRWLDKSKTVPTK